MSIGTVDRIRPGAAPVRRRLSLNRATQLLKPAAAMLFWLALMLVALAASLGWRLALL